MLGYIFEKYINQKQMGAYYTKEDITEYISKNTIIPFLFDAAREARAARSRSERPSDVPPSGGCWRTTPTATSTRRCARARSCPAAEIAAGVDDVRQARRLEPPAPTEYALPTEIWREVVARRKRYAEVRAKLDQRRSPQHQRPDHLQPGHPPVRPGRDRRTAKSPELLRAFWRGHRSQLTVLDPTCGSGAFLFAALNILEPLYEACLERMEGFVRPNRPGEPHRLKFSDFRDVLARRRRAPQPRATSSSSPSSSTTSTAWTSWKRRWKSASCASSSSWSRRSSERDQIEPLPDIDFNIRAGNTLVGYATRERSRAAFERALRRAGQAGVWRGAERACRRHRGEGRRCRPRSSHFRQQQTSMGVPGDRPRTRQSCEPAGRAGRRTEPAAWRRSMG